MKSPLISIIMPVYNAEAYLERCVESILAQIFTDWELILIDDGSPDASGALCDCLALQHNDRSIKVLHKPNGGVASAREAGMKLAQGTYSIHIDPDDWIEPEMLETLYSTAKDDDADIVVCDFLLDYSDTHRVVSRQSVGSSEAFLKALLEQQRHGSLCNKLIRTDLYRLHNLHFPPEMICWEDLYICCNILLHPCRVSYVPRAFYHYDLHSNNGSMTRRATLRTLAAMNAFCDYFDSRLGRDKAAWLNETKAMVKTTAYRCDLLAAEEIRSLYPEINEWFINKYLKSYELVIYCAVARVLNGSGIKSARRFQSINSMLQRIKTRIKKSF